MVPSEQISYTVWSGQYHLPRIQQQDQMREHWQYLPSSLRTFSEETAQTEKFYQRNRSNYCPMRGQVKTLLLQLHQPEEFGSASTRNPCLKRKPDQHVQSSCQGELFHISQQQSPQETTPSTQCFSLNLSQCMDCELGVIFETNILLRWPDLLKKLKAVRCSEVLLLVSSAR